MGAHCTHPQPMHAGLNEISYIKERAMRPIIINITYIIAHPMARKI